MKAILSDFLIVLISVSVFGSLFHMIVLAMGRIFRLSSGWQYILYKAVLVFYLVMPLFTIAFFTVNAKPELIAGMGEDFCEFVVIGLPMAYYFYEYYQELDFIPYAFILWAGGAALFFFSRQIKGHIQLKRLRENSSENEDGGLENLCRKLAAEYQIRSSLKIFYCEWISSPFITGIRKPVIFLPCQDLLKEELEFVLRHEMIHCRQKDILYKRFLHMAKSLYWFNPLIYFFVQNVDDCSELACDELLLAQEDGGRRRKYARCILRFAGDRRILNHAAGISSGNMVEKRISAIANMDRKRGFRKGLWRLFLLMACLFLILILMSMAGSTVLRLILAEWMEAIYFQPVNG